jgi:hypothetical protein
MIMQRMSARGRNVPKGLQVPKTVTVASTLTAEWPLEADSPEELLLEVEALKEKVVAADLAGAKQAEKLSPEEQELAEEMAEIMQNRGEEPVPVGQPLFAFVARISAEDRDKALAEAFTKAKSQASSLARAAGVKLGPLVGLSGHDRGTTGYFEDGMFPGASYAAREYYQNLFGQQLMRDGSDKPNEAVGANPDKLSFTFAVTATFALEE